MKNQKTTPFTTKLITVIATIVIIGIITIVTAIVIGSIDYNKVVTHETVVVRNVSASSTITESTSTAPTFNSTASASTIPETTSKSTTP